jgi:hypothetical protein
MAINFSAAIAGMSPQEVLFEVNRGARFVIYQYAISVVIMSFRRNSPVQFVKAGENPALKSLPWTLLSFFLGWWGIPWGFIYTPQVLYKNLNGGVDVTGYVVAQLQGSTGIMPPPPTFS